MHCSRGRTAQAAINCDYFFIFQSTPSQEGEHQFRKLIFIHTAISIHSLVRGRTARVAFLTIDSSISIHSLVRGRTVNALEFVDSIAISIHSLVRGRTRLIIRPKSTTAFQSTPSQEGEHIVHIFFNVITKFQSTPSQEGEQKPLNVVRPGVAYFNPLPRKRENDDAPVWTDEHLEISIHSLARWRTCVSNG